MPFIAINLISQGIPDFYKFFYTFIYAIRSIPVPFYLCRSETSFSESELVVLDAEDPPLYV